MPKPRILVADSSFPTASEIRDAIERKTGNRYLIGKLPKGKTDVLFRYGSIVSVEGKDPDFNSIQFINLCRDKRRFSEFCRENGIYSPVYYTSGYPSKYPVLIRTTLTGWGGNGIHIVNNQQEFERKMTNGFYWTPFVKCKYEVRVHLFDTRINRIYKKVKVEGEQESPIRNSANGYHFSLQPEDIEGKYEKLKSLCNRLGELFINIGGHFSGVDVGWDGVKKEYFVFEANSAPGLNSVNVEEYADFFIQTLGIK